MSTFFGHYEMKVVVSLDLLGRKFGKSYIC
jgi:hypothetical protein